MDIFMVFMLIMSLIIFAIGIMMLLEGEAVSILVLLMSLGIMYCVYSATLGEIPDSKYEAIVKIKQSNPNEQVKTEISKAIEDGYINGNEYRNIWSKVEQVEEQSHRNTFIDQLKE